MYMYNLHSVILLHVILQSSGSSDELSDVSNLLESDLMERVILPGHLEIGKSSKLMTCIVHVRACTLLMTK